MCIEQPRPRAPRPPRRTQSARARAGGRTESAERRPTSSRRSSSATRATADARTTVSTPLRTARNRLDTERADEAARAGDDRRLRRTIETLRGSRSAARAASASAIPIRSGGRRTARKPSGSSRPVGRSAGTMRRVLEQALLDRRVCLLARKARRGRRATRPAGSTRNALLPRRKTCATRPRRAPWSSSSPIGSRRPASPVEASSSIDSDPSRTDALVPGSPSRPCRRRTSAREVPCRSPVPSAGMGSSRGARRSRPLARALPPLASLPCAALVCGPRDAARGLASTGGPRSCGGGRDPVPGGRQRAQAQPNDRFQPRSVIRGGSGSRAKLLDLFHDQLRSPNDRARADARTGGGRARSDRPLVGHAATPPTAPHAPRTSCPTKRWPNSSACR